MLNKNVETFLGCAAEYAEADIVLFGAPYDSTTSYRPGARFGSKAIRSESFGIELFSPYQRRDLREVAVFDSGDLELPFGEGELTLAAIEERCATILRDDKLPIMLGGEHSVTLGAIRAMVKKFPNLQIIHFDAHCDLRADYLGARYSHGSVMRRAWELVGDGRIHQFGIRSGDLDEYNWAAAGHVKLHEFDFTELAGTIAEIGDKPVYLTIDLDVLDPSVFPGTGTPEAGGVSFLQLLGAVLDICRELRVVGCDLVELAPPLDSSGISTATACKLLRELLLALKV